MFKNAIAFLVTPGFRLDPDYLSRRTARPCGATESRTSGFCPPCDHSTAGLAHHVGGYTLIGFETDDRLLPGSVVAEEVADRAEKLEQQQGFRPGRKQMSELKEATIMELLPRAFTQKRRTLAVFAGGYFIIDTSSAARADAVIETLKAALGELPLAPICTARSITSAMIEWLLGDYPVGLSMDSYAELEKPESGKPAITYKRTVLDTGDMNNRISGGYVPRKVGVTYNEKLSFRINESLHLQQLSSVSLALQNKAGHSSAEEAFDADVTLTVGEVVEALNFVIDELGGLRKSDEPGLFETEESKPA